MTDNRGNLSKEIDQLAFQFQLTNGQPATHILLPLKAQSEIKAFASALSDEIEGLGTAPYVFDRLVSAEPMTTIAQFRGLTMMVYDGSQLIVGRADAL